MPHGQSNQKRRYFLQTIGISGFTVLAGCSGSEDEASTDGDTTSATEGSDTERGTASEDTTSTDQAEDDSESDQESKSEDEDEESAEETYTLTVNLVNHEDGSPHEEGYIIINDDRTISSQADGDPTQVTIDLPPGEHTVEGDVEGEEYRWTTSVEHVQLYEDTTVEVRFAEVKIFSVPVRAGTRDRPADNVDITITREEDGATTTKTTGEDGEVVFDVYGGDYTITGVDTHGNRQTVSRSLTSENTVVYLDEMRPSDWTSLQPIEFTVHMMGRAVVPGVIVKAREKGSNEVSIETEPTDEQGVTMGEGKHGAEYITWVVDAEDGTQYEPLSAGPGGDPNGFVVNGETEVNIMVSESAMPDDADQ